MKQKLVISARRPNCTVYFWYDKNSKSHGGANMSDSPSMAFDFSEMGEEKAISKMRELKEIFLGLSKWSVEKFTC